MPVLTAPDDRELVATSPWTADGPALVVRRRDDADARTVQLTPGKWTIGSSPQCRIYLPDGQVRPLHCLVIFDADAAVASATRWAAGVRLNGHEFVKATLADGDILSVGNWEIEFAQKTPRPSESLEEAHVQEPLSEELEADVTEQYPTESAADEIAVEWSAPTARELDADEEPHSSAFGGTCQQFGDSLLQRLWTANFRARQRVKALITSVRAARFDADARAADFAAIAVELDLARAAFESHAERSEQFRQEAARQREWAEERIAALDAELEDARNQAAAVQAELEAAQREATACQAALQAQLDAQITRCNELNDELARCQQSQAQDAQASQDRVAALEATITQLNGEQQRLTELLQATEQQCRELNDLYRTQQGRAAELESVIDQWQQAQGHAARDVVAVAQQADEGAASDWEAPIEEAASSADAMPETGELQESASWSTPAAAEDPPVAEPPIAWNQFLSEQPAESGNEFNETNGAWQSLEEPAADASVQQPSDWPIEETSVDGDADSGELRTSEAVCDATPIAEELEAVAELPDSPSSESEPAAPAWQPSPQRTSAFADPRPAEPPAWAVEPARQPESEYASTSFIDKYRHLLEDDGERATSSPLSNAPSRVALDDEFLSPSKAPACASPSDDSDEALEAYMANLMKRVTSAAAPQSSAAPAYTPLSSVSASRATGSYSREAGPGESAASAIADQPLEPIDFETLRQTSRKTPLVSDLNVLREIANSSARTAIASHSERRQRESALSRIIVAVTATASAAYLLASAPATNNPQFWAGVAAGSIGIIAAVQVIALERRRAAERKAVDTLSIQDGEQ